jgi:TPR repeat protein
MHRSRTLPLAVLASMAALVTGGAAVAEDRPEEWLRNPSIGNYQAYAEFKMARYAEAKAIWQVLAGREDAEALFNLAILAEDGLGEPRDLQRALALYERSALAGGGKSQYRLGLLHSAGGDIAIDLARARRFLTMAADGGDDDARRRLAVLAADANPQTPFEQAERLGAQRRHAEAAQIYRQLAATGHVRATTRLAWMHEAGRGIDRDLVAAARLFRAAAEAGDGEAQYALAVMLETGRGQPRDAEEAARWLGRAADGGYPPAVVAQRERAAGR